MAHYKETEKGQGLFLTVILSEKIVPGTFEHTLNKLIDKKLDLSIFDRKYQNDETGATAIQPRILLKIIPYCYSLGIIDYTNKKSVSKGEIIKLNLGAYIRKAQIIFFCGLTGVGKTYLACALGRSVCLQDIQVF